MDYTLLDGKKVSAEVKKEIAQEVENIVQAGGKRPHLAAVLVGHDGGSEAYVASKVKACQQVGFASSEVYLEADITEEELLKEIDKLNNNPEVDGYILQLPLPKHINEQRITESIDFRKDVDGLNPINAGRLSIGLPCFVPATPQGVIELMRRYNLDTRGMNCVVLGRSNIVGKPIAQLLMRKGNPGNCTVTVCHSATQDIAKYTREADLIIAALGSPGFLKGDMVKEGAIVIDVGTTRVADPTKKSGSRLVGDVVFEEVAPKCRYITPVPGGVGPMTIVSLMMNTLKAARKEINF